MEPLNQRIIAGVGKTLNTEAPQFSHLKLDSAEAEKMNLEFLQIASETTVEVLSPFTENMPTLIKTTRVYQECFSAGSENFDQESVKNIKRLFNFDPKQEKKLIDKILVSRGWITDRIYPNDTERNLVKKIGLEAFLTGRAIAQIGKNIVNAGELGYATFRLLDDDSKERVAKNVKDLMESANVQRKDMGPQLNFFLDQNKRTPNQT